MNPCELRHIITIQVATITAGSYGSGEKTWGTFAQVWAAMWPQKSQEVVVGDRIEISTHTLVKIRYVAGVLAGMRVLYGTRVFDIVGIRNIDELNREIYLDCVEYV
jgi:SPP1 family predicted phage head-tail adaptor